MIIVEVRNRFKGLYLIDRVPDELWMEVPDIVQGTRPSPWTIACQAPLSMGFSRQEYWSGLPLPSPGDLSNSGIEPGSPSLQADSLSTEL